MSTIKDRVIDEAISLCEKNSEINPFRIINNIIANPELFKNSEELSVYYRKTLKYTIAYNLSDIFFLSHSEFDKNVVEELSNFFIYKTK